MRLLVLATLLTLLAAPAAAVPPPDEQPALQVPPRRSELAGFGPGDPYRLYDDWLVVCDNVATCVALSVVLEGSATMRIARSGDWNALPDPTVDLSRTGFDGPTVNLVLQPQSGGAHATPGRRARTVIRMIRLAPGVFGMTPTDAAAFTAAARTARITQVVSPDGQHLAEVSLRGLVAAMDRIDHVQTRTGTVTGTYTRGEILVPLAAIMPPPAPEIARVTGAPEPGAAALGTRAFQMICGTGVARRAGDAVVWRMASGHRIVAVDCGVEGLNGGRIWLLADAGGHLDLASFPTPDMPTADGIAGFLPNGWFDHMTGILTAVELGRMEGDCGSVLSWQWTPDGFRLAEARRMPLCTGTPQAQWPRTWTTRTPD